METINNNTKKTPHLLFCLFMDAVGVLSYFLPFLGEWFDLLWAPLSAFIFYRSFGGKTGLWGSFVNLIEEVLPYTDFFPTFTITYILKKFFR